MKTDRRSAPPQRIARRTALKTGAAAVALGTGLATGQAKPLSAATENAPMVSAQNPPPAWSVTNTPKRLPFAPDSLPGLSERLIMSHWENNYGGAVRRLNLIAQQLADLPADAPPYLLGALKREELIATNSMVLHELYFANLGGTASPPSALADAIGAAFGDYGRWEREFRGTGAALGGGSGWVVLSYQVQNGSLRNSWASDHTQNLAFGVPLLVLDMYEHAYAIDYGAGAAQYINAFMDNVNWTEVARRLDEAQARRLPAPFAASTT
jgi:superoxide dismutase, Fe-Mn family